MKIKHNYSLKKHNTFGIEARAIEFVALQAEAELLQIITQKKQPVFVLGGGSNILLTNDLDALVLKNEIKGKKVVKETKEAVEIKIGGGENWHELVLWCLSKNYGGIENLSLIPGTVGAAPIQNIGAYGVELKDVFQKLEAVELASGNTHIFTKEQCQFGYRDSIFKRELKGKYLISQVYLKLTKQAKINISYGAILNTLKEMGVEEPNIQEVSKAIIHIRQSKLPDPAKIGNAGSFFKNPEVDKSFFENLKIQFPNIVHYDLPSGKVKIPAGWLIEQAGWKGKRFGDAGCHAKQALVLVNFGNAKGQEINDLADRILASVKEKFGIDLQKEVNVW